MQGGTGSHFRITSAKVGSISPLKPLPLPLSGGRVRCLEYGNALLSIPPIPQVLGCLCTDPRTHICTAPGQPRNVFANLLLADLLQLYHLPRLRSLGHDKLGLQFVQFGKSVLSAVLVQCVRDTVRFVVFPRTFALLIMANRGRISASASSP